jgi:glycopeptide antibiotics resistance protein
VPESVKFCLENILGNIALFFPLGVLLPLVGNRVNAFHKVFAAAVCGSLGIEVTQLLSRQMGIYRTVDIDDVLLNIIGASLGYVCYAVVRHYANADKGEQEGL